MRAVVLSRRSAVVVLIAALSLCLIVWAASALHTDSGGRSESGSATISGELAVCCDARGSLDIAGSVTIRRLDGHAVRTIATDRRGYFTAHVEPGTYVLTGQSTEYSWPTGSCHAQSDAIARAGRVTTVRVTCQGQ